MKRDANILGSNPPDKWFVAIGATVFEYSLERLKTDVQNRTLQRDALVWCATVCKWVRVDDEPWLRGMLPGPAHRQPPLSLPPPPRIGDFLQASLGRKPPPLPLPSLPPVPPLNPDLALAVADDDKTLRVAEETIGDRLATAASSRPSALEEADDTQRVSPERASRPPSDLVDSDDLNADTRVDPLEFEEVTTVRHSLLEDLRAQVPIQSPERCQSLRTALPRSEAPRAIATPSKPNNPSLRPPRASLPPPVLPVRTSRPVSRQVTVTPQSAPPQQSFARPLPPVPTPPTRDGLRNSTLPTVREPSIAPSDGSSVFTQHDLAPSLACPRTFDSQPSGRFARLAPTAAPDHQSLTTALSLILPLGRGTEGAKRKLGVVVGSLSAGALLLFGLFALGREVASAERLPLAQPLVHPATPVELPSKTSAAPTSIERSSAIEPTPLASSAPKLASELELEVPGRDPSPPKPKTARRWRFATEGRATSPRRPVKQQSTKPAEPAKQAPQGRAGRDYWMSPGF